MIWQWEKMSKEDYELMSSEFEAHAGELERSGATSDEVYYLLKAIEREHLKKYNL